MASLKKSDSAVYKLVKQEEKRQQEQLSMIPSENFFSPAVREAVGSVFSHKYSEGNVGHRYYEGNEQVDALETLAIQRAKKAFKLPKDWDVNVQALSGSNANVAVYLALLQMGDTIMGMYLPDGGHLSHGWSYEPGKAANPNNPVYAGGSRKVNITSRMFRTIQYKTSPKNQQLDYKEIEKIAKKYKPKLIIAGGTAYPRLLDHKKMKAIAKSVGAYYMADIAHEAGLIAAGVIPSPVGIADVVTLTTHKTLRSGRGAIILAPEELIKKINKAVLPGLQGGPHNHNIAGIAVGLGEVLKPSYKKYAKQVISNTKTLARELQKYDFNLVSGGADKHLILVNLSNKPVLGRPFSRALAYANIIANFNTMPQETRSPMDPSALRLGTPWLTTRGMKEKEMKKVARWIHEVMEISAQWKDLPFKDFDKKAKASNDVEKVAAEVTKLTKKFPLEI
jgi:glycine hydroxymethyltransferase